MQPDRVDLTQAEQNQQERSKRSRRQILIVLGLVGAAILMIGVTGAFALLIPPDGQLDQPSRLLMACGVGSAALLIGIGALWATLRLMGSSVNELVQGRRQVADVLGQVAPELPKDRIAVPEAQPVSTRRIGLSMLAMLVVTVALSPLYGVTKSWLDALWTDAPGIVAFVPVFVLIWLVMPVVQHFIPAIRPPGSEGKTLSRTLLDAVSQLVVMGIIIFFALFAVDTGIDWLASLIKSKVLLGIAVLLGGLMLIMVLTLAVSFIPALWVFGPLKAARYDEALSRARMMRQAMPNNAMFLFMEGTVLDYAGRHDESLDILNSSLVEGQKQATAESQSVALENRGYTLMKAGRYPEAQAAFEGAIQIRPEGSGPYSGLAELNLRQGLDPKRAVELAERALRNKGASFMMHFVDAYRWGEMWSVKAWALAASGDHEAARQALDQAFRRADKGFRAEMSMLHYRAAQVAKLRGDASTAADHLKKAFDLDPNGAAGKLAREAQ